MSPDRYGDPYGDGLDDTAHRARCPKWLGEDAHGRPRPCLRCKPHLAAGTRRAHDYADTTPSDRAREAIARAEQEDRNRHA